ncbi:FAD-dependent oxidoreductase [Rhizobium pisi]|uniref:FAD-dependent oxidoreductase n=1 Tax=Rhizobium pisi TaxID=574561 RepID=UPI001FE08E62|nr:FAD-dependent oxidoreductase [Rhizobium pisi]
MPAATNQTSRCKIAVIGAGFAGLAAVRALRDSNADITLVDRNNHHVFLNRFSSRSP